MNNKAITLTMSQSQWKQRVHLSAFHVGFSPSILTVRETYLFLFPLRPAALTFFLGAQSAGRGEVQTERGKSLASRRQPLIGAMGGNLAAAVAAVSLAPTLPTQIIHLFIYLKPPDLGRYVCQLWAWGRRLPTNG